MGVWGWILVVFVGLFILGFVGGIIGELCNKTSREERRRLQELSSRRLAERLKQWNMGSSVDKKVEQAVRDHIAQVFGEDVVRFFHLDRVDGEKEYESHTQGCTRSEIELEFCVREKTGSIRCLVVCASYSRDNGTSYKYSADSLISEINRDFDLMVSSSLSDNHLIFKFYPIVRPKLHFTFSVGYGDSHIKELCERTECLVRALLQLKADGLYRRLGQKKSVQKNYDSANIPKNNKDSDLPTTEKVYYKNKE